MSAGLYFTIGMLCISEAERNHDLYRFAAASLGIIWFLNGAIRAIEAVIA